MKELLKKLIPVKLRRGILSGLNRFWVKLCRALPLQRYVLFYTIRSDGSLTDNALMLYNALACKKKIYAHRLPHTLIQKAKAYYLISRAKVIVTDDYCRYLKLVKLRGNQSAVQIWHGCGAFKKFALDADDTGLSKNYERAIHSQYTAVAVTGENCRSVFAGAFGVDESVCLATGIPETDLLINNSADLREEFYEKYPAYKGKTIYLYCPTFREKDGVLSDFDPGIDWDALSRGLKEDEAFIIRRHPHMNRPFFDGGYDNITDMTDERTILIMSAASVVITDYSSVIHSAVLLNVPPVFYCPDYKEYSRGFYLRFPDDLPGEMITEGSELLNAVRRAKENPPTGGMRKFREEQVGACDGHATERLAALIESYLGK